ncbi:rust resistance kinase Lr10-like isoform X1 [Prunus avium]|uniref:Rust resistance kinase Lr10-like isoform X1 n=1 Tax=Prunus avium TaxID=42229 RepID=A0A6P5SWX4_PRUAV|nr:rust resistance kinase Lr10-like isoform X1 [Prunus avium]
MANRTCVLVIVSVLLLGLGAFYASLILAGLAYATRTLITENHGKCIPSACGKIHNITSPFRLPNDPNQSNCTNWNYNLFCHNNLTVLEVYSGNYSVQAINHDNLTIRVVDPGIRNNDFSSIPRYSLSIYNLTYSSYLELASSTTPITFFKCAKAVNSSVMRTYNYVKQGNITASDMEDGCSIEWTTLMSKSFLYGKDRNFSYHDIHSALGYGFELHFYSPRTSYKLGIYKWLTLGAYFPIRSIFGVPFLAALLIYKRRRRHLSMYSSIEDFLQSDNNLIPIRYSYSDIKKMTSRFNEKLGEGGYGSVFKGKLRSGRFVAVKMLEKPKANGQDFISEVATIGRIHHFNMVQLVGYCVEGSKRALIYNFMPNGSLDKYIYGKEGSNPLSCKKMYEISLGVAQGIEYLHRGCDMQILHFDIKPHNILLDENFIPKISDFGLAKLYPVGNTIISLTAARGTMGYMAPELFYKNIGGVSYKADVYSFGMLLMEMASRRKNLNADIEHSSQIYFPLWVSEQFFMCKEFEMDDATEEEKKIIKKMIIAALWCIQLKPSDRPSMNKVIEMLEGEVECLQLPPKHLLCPQQEMPKDNLHGNSNPMCSNAELTCSTLSAR